MPLPEDYAEEGKTSAGRHCPRFRGRIGREGVRLSTDLAFENPGRGQGRGRVEHEACTRLTLSAWESVTVPCKTDTVFPSILRREEGDAPVLDEGAPRRGSLGCRGEGCSRVILSGMSI